MGLGTGVMCASPWARWAVQLGSRGWPGLRPVVELVIPWGRKGPRVPPLEVQGWGAAWSSQVRGRGLKKGGGEPPVGRAEGRVSPNLEALSGGPGLSPRGLPSGNTGSRWTQAGGWRPGSRRRAGCREAPGGPSPSLEG